MARVLWLTAQPPGLGLGGGPIRQAHLLAAVAAEHEVHLAVVGSLRDADLRARLAGLVELPVPPARPPSGGVRRRVDHLRSVATSQPADCVDQAPARALLRAAAADEASHDVVVVEHLALAPLLPATRRARWVAAFQHLPSLQAEQEVPLATSAAARWYWRREAAKARRVERWAATAYDRVVVCSDEDAAHLPAGAHVVPNGVDVERCPVTDLPDRPALVFTGSLDYRPNVDGVQWFAQAVLPLVRAERPDVTLRLVGRRPVPAVLALASEPGIEVHADVEAVDPFLLDARVAVVPLRIGSGTRLKALEAMAAGRPVVGTTVGLSGLGLTDGVDARLADDAPAFAAAVLDLLADDGAARDQAAAGRRRVEDDFSWSRIGRAYAADLGALAALAAPAAPAERA